MLLTLSVTQIINKSSVLVKPRGADRPKMCPSKSWVTVSLKRKLVNELSKIAESKEIAHTSLINQVLWTYVDQWKFESLKAEMKSLLAECKNVIIDLRATKGEA